MNDIARIMVSIRGLTAKMNAPQAIASNGIQTTLTNVQKGEHPRVLSPVQSSEEARNASGIADVSSALVHF